MEKYQVLARKYRPQNFQDVVGQEAIITTLKNAIRLGRVSNAYLFSGSRGTGKTTLARIFAKGLNCKNITKDQEPCNQCTSCLEIATSRSLDVIEIDGASNRGIDDIRQINENIGYSASSGNYKIYIIDEVHMLTKEAFNALLKTLEEPPPMSKFFFATTEPHKVLPTIISRCQRFDLARIPQEKIVQKLDLIVQDLQREVQSEALHLIARLAEGSLRDAVSLLDQVLCYEEGIVTSEMIRKTLGFLPQDYFFYLDQAVQSSNTSFAFECASYIFQSGKHLAYFLEELVEHYRHLLLAKMGEDKKRFSHLSESLQKKYRDHAQVYTEEHLLYILDFLMDTLSFFQKSAAKQVTLEMILLHIIRSKQRIFLPHLVQRLVQLESQISSGIKEENPEKSQPIVPKEEMIKKDAPIAPPQLEKVPFSLPKAEEKKEPVSSKSPSHYDTLLRFAAVELEGTIKTDGEMR